MSDNFLHTVKINDAPFMRKVLNHMEFITHMLATAFREDDDLTMSKVLSLSCELHNRNTPTPLFGVNKTRQVELIMLASLAAEELQATLNANEFALPFVFRWFDAVFYSVLPVLEITDLPFGSVAELEAYVNSLPWGATVLQDALKEIRHFQGFFNQLG